MALQKQVVVVPLSKGLKQDSHPHIQQKGFLQIVDRYWDRSDESRKRHGLTSLTGSYTEKWLATYKDRPVLFGDESVRSFAGNGFNDGSFQQVATPMMGSLELVQLESRNQITYGSVQEVSNVRVVAYEEYDSLAATKTYWIRSYDTRDGRLLDSLSVGSALTAGIRCVYAGGTLLRVVYVTGAGTVNYCNVNTTTGVIGTPSALTATLNPDIPIDVASFENSTYDIAIVGCDAGASGDFRIITLTGAAVETTATTALTACKAVGVCKIREGVVVVFYYDDAGTNNVYAKGYAPNCSVPITEDGVWAHASNEIKAISGGRVSDTVVNVYLTVENGSATTGQHARWVDKNDYTDSSGTGVGGTAALFAMGCALAAKPLWHTASSHQWVPMYCPLTGTDQQQWIIVRDDGKLGARCRHGYAVGQLIHLGLTHTVAAGQWRLALPSRVSQDVWGLASVTYTATATTQPRTVETADHLLLGGALPWSFDGRSVVEQGFLWYPPVIGATLSGGALSLTRTWVAIYEEVDDQGCLHRSAASAEHTETLSTQKATITVPTLGVTARTKVRIALYGTLDAGNTFYRVADQANDPTVQSVSFTDETSDATLATHAKLYTDGGVQVAVQPHPWTVSTLHQGRPCYVPTEWPSSKVFYGKPPEVTVAAEYTDGFVINVPPEGGAITALATYLDRLIIFKRHRIYAVDGTALDSTGYGRGFSEPYLIAEGVGCTQQHTVVQVPQGLMFLAADGFWALDSTLQPQPAGGDCKYLTDTYTYTHGLIVPDLHQAIWFSTDGHAAVFDWLHGNWSSYSNHAADGATQAWGGKVYHKAASGTAVKVQDSSTHRDGGTDINSKIRTAWLSFAGHLNVERLYSIMPLGQCIDPHLLRAKSAFSMDPTWVDNQEFATDDGAITRIRTNVVPDSCLELDDDGNTGFGNAIIIDEERGHLIVAHSYKLHDFGAGPVYCGGVYVLSWDSGELIQELLPTDAADQVAWAGFGYRLARDDDWLVISCPAPAGSLGHIYLFQWTGSEYTYRQRLSGDGALVGNFFGSDVGLSGSLCVVGDEDADNNGTNSGTIHVFRLSAGVWSEDVAAKTHAPTTQNNQYFGHAVAADAPYIAASANQFYGDYDDQGRAYVFEDGGVGNPLTLRDTLVPPAGLTGDLFGDSIELVGTRCAVGWPGYDPPGGKYNSGRIEVFRQSALLWPRSQSLDLPTASGEVNASLGYGAYEGGSVRIAGNYLLGGARGWEGLPGASGWPGASFLWEIDPATELYVPVNVAHGFNPEANPYAIYPGAGYANFGMCVAITSTGKMAIAAPTEYGDWDSNQALPEGPPPAFSYCGTVRQYQLLHGMMYPFDTPEHYGDGLAADYQDKAYMVEFGTSRQKVTSVMVELSDEALSGQALVKGFSLTAIAFLIGVKPGMYRPGEARSIP